MFIILCANGPGSVRWNDLLALLPNNYAELPGHPVWSLNRDTEKFLKKLEYHFKVNRN